MSAQDKIDLNNMKDQMAGVGKISGVLNLTSSTCISSLPSMKENELRLYIAGDSNGDYPAKNGDKYVKVNDMVKVANFLNTDSSLYVNVGDIIAVVGNKTDLGITKVCRVIPLNDAKADLTDGIMTKADKSLLTGLSTNVVKLLNAYVKKATLKRDVITNFVNYQFRDYTGLQNTGKTLNVQGTTFEQIELIISSTAYRVTDIYSWGEYKISSNGQLQLISSGSRKLALVKSGDIKYRAGDKITVTYSNLQNTHITCNAGDDYVNIVIDSDNQFIIEVKKALPEHLVLNIPRYTYINEILTTETRDGNTQYLTLTAQDNSSIGVKITDYGYIPDGSVTSSKLASNAVQNHHIQAGSVNESEIASSAVTADKIANNAISSEKIVNSAITEDKIHDGAVTESKMGTDLLNKLNSAGMSIAGTLNLSDSRTAATMGSIYDGLSNGQMKFYLLTDSAGTFSESWITANSLVAALFGKDKLGASVGDICVIAKLNSLPVYRIMPLNDAKAENAGEFPGADGLETVWDKTQVNKIPGIEATANEARRFGVSAYMPSLGESNMNNALKQGVYPWCTLGRPTGATGAFTCIVKKSYNADGGGYYTIEQTAYGREGELGQVYKRIIFQKNDGSDTQYGEWQAITNQSSETLVIEKTLTGSSESSLSCVLTQEEYNDIYNAFIDRKPLIISVMGKALGRDLIFTALNMVGSSKGMLSSVTFYYSQAAINTIKEYYLFIYYDSQLDNYVLRVVVSAGANAYSHPVGSAASKAAGFYKISTDAQSHVASVVNVTKDDITKLGIPAQDTTYSPATTSANGLMSAADKTKLDGIVTATDAEIDAIFTEVTA